jgi:hypothetical protein
MLESHDYEVISDKAHFVKVEEKKKKNLWKKMSLKTIRNFIE